MAQDALIDTWGLSKRYAGNKAYSLRDLNLHVGGGEIYGFLGPNGAGKSTTIRLLMNFIQPTDGHANIMGKNVVKDSVTIKKSVGYLASDMAMYPKMTGAQFLDYMGQLQHNVDEEYKNQLIHLLQADPAQKLGNLSRGNKQKFAIIQAFMHKPQVLILDEPSSGLDPLMQEAFYKLLREAKERGAAIFMSSHVLSEVQKVCDRVGIIKNGKLVAERSIAELEKEAAHTFEVTFRESVPTKVLEKLKGVTVTPHDERRAAIRLDGELAPLLATLAKYDVVQMDVHQLDLEELFMHFYDDEEEQ